MRTDLPDWMPPRPEQTPGQRIPRHPCCIPDCKDHWGGYAGKDRPPRRYRGHRFNKPGYLCFSCYRVLHDREKRVKKGLPPVHRPRRQI